METEYYYTALNGCTWILKDDEVTKELVSLRAENVRLREAVEWACGDIESHINLGDMDDWRPFKHMAELRRRAKEG